jgi:hypothetical protein
VEVMMQAVDNFIGPQILTTLIPLGVLFAVALWVFFSRKSAE